MSAPTWIITFWNLPFILGSFALTTLADAAREPLKSETFFWRHWWHTPFLVYTNIAGGWVFSLIFYFGGSIYHILTVQAFATILTLSLTSSLWVYLTQTPHVSSPKSDDDMFPINFLLLLGSVISVTGVFTITLLFLGFYPLLSYLPMSFLPAMFLAMIVGLAVYFTGFVFRSYIIIQKMEWGHH